MNLINILIIVSAAAVIFLLWIIVGTRYLQNLRHGIREQWDFIDESLRKRHDLIPNLVETIRWYLQNQEELIGKFVVDRSLAAKEYFPGPKKIELEHELSMTINKAIDLGNMNKELASDTNFLELRTEIDDLEKNIEEKTKKYNEMARYYNRHREIILLLPLALIFRFKRENIFEVEV